MVHFPFLFIPSQFHTAFSPQTPSKIYFLINKAIKKEEKKNQKVKGNATVCKFNDKDNNQQQ